VPCLVDFHKVVVGRAVLDTDKAVDWGKIVD